MKAFAFFILGATFGSIAGVMGTILVYDRHWLNEHIPDREKVKEIVNKAIDDVKLPAAMVNEKADDKPEYKLLKTIRGNGKAVTETFEVKDDWKLRWEFKFEPMYVYVYDMADKRYPVWWGAMGSGSSEITYIGKGFAHQKGGKYCVQIDGEGAWKIEVFQGSNYIK